MPLDDNLRVRMERALRVLDEHQTQGPRLIDDARRLNRRVGRFLAMDLIPATDQLDALELACYSLQLPLRDSRTLSPTRLGLVNLRDRAEQAAELLVGTFGDQVEESLLDRTTRLLHELPQRAPMLDEARLLADAVNLEDFGVVGLLLGAIQLTRQGNGLAQIAEGAAKRDQYGYWEARLKDGFHFAPVRQIARRRLGNARAAAALLLEEMKEEE